jgi:hypothetical protein
MMHGRERSDSAASSCEADEQSGFHRSAAGGAKGSGQGERTPAKQAPDTGASARARP